MAIEFRCPYCTATIRVRDDSAGKVGHCPKCETRVRIPQIEIPGATEMRAGVEAIGEKSPAANAVSGDGLTGLVDPESVDILATNVPGELPVVSAADDPVTSKYLKRIKKRRTNFAALVPPLIFGGLLVLVGLLYVLWNRPNYEGQLTGEVLNRDQLIQIQIPGDPFEVDSQLFKKVLDDLREHPSSVNSNLVRLTFTADTEEMNIALQPGAEADLVKVSIMEIPAVRKKYENHRDQLDDQRVEELKAELGKLCEKWAVASEEEKKKSLPEYRYSVVYNSFVKGLGRICYAKIGNQMYPCVHENRAGELYFLVPAETKLFSIREREDLMTKKFFLTPLNVRVNIPSSDNPPVAVIEQADESDESEEETKAKTDNSSEDSTVDQQADEN